MVPGPGTHHSQSGTWPGHRGDHLPPGVLPGLSQGHGHLQWPAFPSQTGSHISRDPVLNTKMSLSKDGKTLGKIIGCGHSISWWLRSTLRCMPGQCSPGWGHCQVSCFWVPSPVQLLLFCWGLFDTPSLQSFGLWNREQLKAGTSLAKVCSPVINPCGTQNRCWLASVGSTASNFPRALEMSSHGFADFSA